MEWPKGFKLMSAPLTEKKIDLDDDHSRFQPRDHIRGNVRRSTIMPDIRTPPISSILSNTERDGVTNEIPPDHVPFTNINRLRHGNAVMNRVKNINTSVEYEKRKHDEKKARRFSIPWF